MKSDLKSVGNQMPLGLLTAGEKAEVIGIRGASRPGTCRPGIHRSDNETLCRMEDMGLRPGKEVEMLNSEGQGPMLIRIDESRIAVGRGMAMRIIVRRNDR
ncbi:MAG: ferrous iron transport protein A [Armatimonadetes bacterium]|nr:ferrous iron transport protein A [Armatimonadota bacterium]